MVGVAGAAVLAQDGEWISSLLFRWRDLPARSRACLRPFAHELVLTALVDGQRLGQLGQTLLVELYRSRLPCHR